MPKPMVELIVILLALIVITPFLTLYLLGRYKKLRADLDQSREEHSRQYASLQREIGELKKQLAAGSHPTVSAAEKPMERPVSPPAVPAHEPPVSRPQPPAPVKLPPPVINVPTPLKLGPPPAVPPVSSGAERKSSPTVPAVTSTISSPDTSKVSPPADKTTTPLPAPPLRTPSVMASAAPISRPAPLSGVQVSAPRPTLQQRMKAVSAIEETLGTNWLFKLGIVILVIGIAFFGIYELGVLGPLGRAGISFLTAIFLLGAGMALEKNQRYRLMGRGGIGAGWALLFFSAFGSYHVEAMRIFPANLEWLTINCALMLLIAVAMALHTLRYRSQFVTGLAFLLGYFTVSLSPNDVYSLSSGVFLAIGLVYITLKMRWFELELFGILSTYLTHLYWLYRLLGIRGAQGHPFPQYHPSLTILFLYWLIFRFSYLKRSIASAVQEHVSTAAALLNMLLLLGCLRFQSVDPKLAYIALSLVGAAEFLASQLPAIKRRREAFIVLSVAGTALMLAAVPSHYADNHVAILWLVGTEVLLMAGTLVKEIVFRRLGLLMGLLVGIRLVAFDFRGLVHLRSAAEKLEVSAGVLFLFCAVVFYLNDLAIGTRWKEFFERSPDRLLLTAHSYLGAFAGAAAAWSLFTRDSTALAFAAVMVFLAATGRVVASRHLQVQYVLLGALTLYRAAVINLHWELPLHAHLRMRLVTLPILGAAYYLTAKLSAPRDHQARGAVSGSFAAAGTALLALLIWLEVPELWQPFAFIAFAVILSEAAGALAHQGIGWHPHVLSALAIFTALSADPSHRHIWHTIPVRALGALPVVAGLYWLAKRIRPVHPQYLDVSQVPYTWTATGMMVWVLQEALHAPWIAVGWILLAVALALSTRWSAYKQLAWQANVVAFLAVLRAFFYNYEFGQRFWGPITLRVFTISLIAAGLYFLSRAAAPEERFARVVAFLHSFAATGLLAYLAWYEAPNGWLAPLWATFALVLAIVYRRFELPELPWQSHALAGITLLRVFAVNLHLNATWRGLSVRLLSLAIVAVIFYTLSRVIHLPEGWRRRELQHIYSWAASVMVSLLLWYELQALSIAVGWAIFGLVLFEYGILRHITQFRYQAYVALSAAFVRIFFVNLTAGEAGKFWGPRVYTILPLVLIFYFVYAQLPQKEESVARDRQLYCNVLVAYLGTASVVALFYFQFPAEWVVTSWAAVVFILLGASLALDRALFLYQGLLLTLSVLARGMVHNLLGGSYFRENDWTGNYLVVGSTAAILLASLPLAFRLRDHFTKTANSSRLAQLLEVVTRRPEQLEFFAPVILLTVMLALRMKTGMITVSWGIEGVLVFVLALAVNERSFRLTGLGLLLLCVGKIIARDVWGLQPRDRYITLIVVGIALTFVSFLYTRYRDTIRQYL